MEIILEVRLFHDATIILPFMIWRADSLSVWPIGSFHLGRGRVVPPDSLFHRTVKLRMDDEAMQYKPKAVYQAGSVTFVG